MAVNSSIIRASISVSSRRVIISISSWLLVIAVVLSAESVFGFTTTNTQTQTSFNYCASSSAWKSRLPIQQQPFTPSHIPKTSTTRQSSSMSSTSLNSQSLPTDETLSSLLQIAIKASKLAGEIILGNAHGADVLKTKDSTRDLLTLIDPLCEKVSCCDEMIVFDGCGWVVCAYDMHCIKSTRYEHLICICMNSKTAITHMNLHLFASLSWEIHLCVQRSISNASTFVLTLYTSFDHIICSIICRQSVRRYWQSFQIMTF